MNTKVPRSWDNLLFLADTELCTNYISCEAFHEGKEIRSTNYLYGLRSLQLCIPKQVVIYSHETVLHTQYPVHITMYIFLV